MTYRPGAPLRVLSLPRPASLLLYGNEPTWSWVTLCRACPKAGVIARSTRLDRAGWIACMAAAYAHLAAHKKGERP